MTSSIEDETLSYENSEWEGREKIRTKRDGVEEEISSPEYSELESHKQMRVKRDEDSCLRCICERESNCRPLACKWDVNSLSCGYFQVTNV
uniref:lysozyme n=1 Tax=Acrobeloides nanus TaxID=290746 RepID=A0A914D5J7_9BILA